MLLEMQIIGRVGDEPKVNAVSEDTQAINFDVAHTEKYKNRKDETVERTTWVRCTKYVKVGKDGLKDFIHKGDVIRVFGVPSVQAYKTSAGDPGASLELKVSEVTFLPNVKTA